MEEIKKEFKGTVVKQIWSNNESYWVYALNVSKNDYPEIQQNKYNNVTICGNVGELSSSVTYNITAIETENKYGISYDVVNIRRDTPTSETDVLMFLTEILTPTQASTIFENYPDIIDRVKENRLDDIDFNKLKGIKEKTFDKIVCKITENFFLADLVIEFQGYFSLNILKKIYEKYKSVDALKHALSQNPYKCLCGLAGVGFKKADSILLDIEKISNENIKQNKEPIVKFENSLIGSEQRCLSCILYLLSENENNGHTKMNLSDLRKQVLLIVPECIECFAESIKSKEIYYNKETMDVALTKTYNIEKYIADTILNAINGICDIWNFDLEKYKKVNGFELSDEQFKVLEVLCNNNICLLNGFAGSGKSASTQAVISMLKDNHKTFKLLAPTGKASKVIAEYTNNPAYTIHRGLGFMPPNDWMFNEEHQLDEDVIIVDEFSMVDIFLFKRLLSAINFKNTRLLLIGDNAQLPSVQCGNLLHDFMSSNIIPTVTLSKVFRYGEGGLMKIATDVRCCKSYLTTDQNSKKVTSFGNNEDYTYIDVAAEAIPNQLIALYKKLLSKGYHSSEIQVLTSKNVGNLGTVKLNKYIQKVSNPRCNNESEVSITYGKDDTKVTYYKDDLIIQIQNNYKAPMVDECGSPIYNNFTEEQETAFVANGETGVIKMIGLNYVIIDFGGICVKYDKSNLGQIRLGYSISIHKSQGSTIKIVILCTPSSDIYMLNSNLIYVGLTRMKEKCYHFGNVKSVNMAVSKKANLIRHTFMNEFLTAQNKTNNN